MRRGKKDDCEQQELNGPPSGHFLEGLFSAEGPMGATSWARWGFFWATNRATKKFPRLGSKRAHQDIFGRLIFMPRGPSRGPLGTTWGHFLAFSGPQTRPPKSVLDLLGNEPLRTLFESSFLDPGGSDEGGGGAHGRSTIGVQPGFQTLDSLSNASFIQCLHRTYRWPNSRSGTASSTRRRRSSWLG